MFQETIRTRSCYGSTKLLRRRGTVRETSEVMNRFVWLLLSLFMLSFVGASSPPTISDQPQSPTVPVGQPAIFVVGAAGEELSYQWLKNGQDIAGATQSTFIIPAVALSDAASF